MSATETSILLIHLFILYSVFQKELYNVQSLCNIIQRTYTVFCTVLTYQNTPSFSWDSYGKRIPPQNK
jgi:hypothetical protein